MGTDQEMPRYRCHKEVHALQIALIEKLPDGGAQITPLDNGYGPLKVDEDYMNRHKPRAGGYYVVYADGYLSFSPGKVFEEGYTRA